MAEIPYVPQKFKDAIEEANELSNLGKREEALSILDQLAEECPDWWAVHYNRGNVLNELERWQEALQSLDRALEIATTPPWGDVLPPVIISWIHNNRGSAYSKGLRFALAKEAFEAALAVYPDDDVSRDNLEVLKEIDDMLLEGQPDLKDGKLWVH
jgi:tetratricopeptide (TPR) repeat protein